MSPATSTPPGAAVTAPLPPGDEAPALASLVDPATLGPRDLAGLVAVSVVAALTAAGVALSLRPGAAWLAGQLLLALALVQWLVLLHEAGHGTLFRTRALNISTAWLAGLFAGIPAPAWRLVHAQHHRWTGWQDRDPTTRSLVPRPLGRLERWTLDLTWALGLPLVAVLYRRPYWALPALLRARPGRRAALVAGALVHLTALAALFALVPLEVVVRVLGLATLLALMVEDPLLLSQHTHVPLGVAGPAQVLPVPARAQPWYTRSLRLPGLASLLLLGFDAHEKHHAWPQVPGWRLRAIPWTPPNELGWWRWLVEARRLPGHVLLFRNRAGTGAPL